MSKYKVGSRVGAILGTEADKKLVKFFGYGVFQGDKPAPALGGRENPCILLDNGQEVWGYESWWGTEEYIKAQIDHYRDKGGFTIEMVDIPKWREQLPKCEKCGGVLGTFGVCWNCPVK